MDKDELDLEQILAEFSPSPMASQPEEPEEERPAPEPEEQEPAPEAEVEEGKPEPQPETPEPKEEPAAEPAEPPAAAPEPEQEKERKRKDKKGKKPWQGLFEPKPPVVKYVGENVIEFPEEDTSVTRRIGKLMEKADEYAEQMFPADDVPDDPERERREQLLPGVDWEEEPTHVPPARKRHRERSPKPDVPPMQLAARYKKGLGFLHTRAVLALVLALVQIYWMLALPKGWPIPLPMTDALQNGPLRYQISAVLLGVSALVGLDVLGKGLGCLIKLQMEWETVLLFSVVAAVGDALTMPILGERGGQMPYCGVVALAIFFALWGRFLRRRALRQSCRVAGSATRPYRVSLEEKFWDNADAYAKSSGESTGYGSQVQGSDGLARAQHIAAPLILLLCVACSLLASVGQQKPELFFWGLSATLTAGCGFTAFLAFSMPFSAVTTRLAKVGAALAGWDGYRPGKGEQGVVLTDGDLFPPGSVTLNGLKMCGELSIETAASYTATLIREMDSGLEKPFSDLLRTQGTIYRKVTRVMFHEGGVSGVIGGRQVLVGSAAFMEIMHIELPQGLKVKNAVFCAVSGTLEAIFALNYRLHPAIRPAIQSLIANHLNPILATRDFLVIPDMLRQRFKLPVNKMEFPNLDRRRELSEPGRRSDALLAAVLCREGLGPYAEAVVGGKRLVSAVSFGGAFALLGSLIGIALAVYLVGAGAFASLSAGTMLAYLLLWLVPGALISSWTCRY